MVIYDKNQLTFNIVFVLILLVSISLNVFYARNFALLDERFISMNNTLSLVEENQVFNFIQGGHKDIRYQMTVNGFYVSDADDYGFFSGPSMQPTIFDGNILIEQIYDGTSDLEDGQIIRFLRDDGTAVIHRVRADYGQEVFVQGDSLKEGEIIDKSQITHMVIGILFT